jgi:hypothetical protein
MAMKLSPSAVRKCRMDFANGRIILEDDLRYRDRE